jgi:hypothetical protein
MRQQMSLAGLERPVTFTPFPPKPGKPGNIGNFLAVTLGDRIWPKPGYSPHFLRTASTILAGSIQNHSRCGFAQFKLCGHFL